MDRRLRWGCHVAVFAIVVPAPGPLRGLQTAPLPAQESPRALMPSAVDLADSLFLAMDPASAFSALEVRLEFEPDDFEAAWRAARAALVLGVMSEGWEKRDPWFRTAVAYASRAAELRPDDTEGLAWQAAAVGRRAIESPSARENARLGSEVWSLTERILAMDPDHALGHDMRGKLHQEVMKLQGWQRFLGRIFLRSDPLKNASWEASERHLRRAIELEGTAILGYLDLGETYFAQGKLDEAEETFRAGLELPNIYPPDEIFKGQIRRFLRRIENRRASGG